MSLVDGEPRCDMRRDCTRAPTHIGEKGYIYCTECAARRNTSGYERCRKMQGWEIDLIRSGKTLSSYRPVSRKELARRIACAGCGLSRKDIEEPGTGDLCGCAFESEEK